MRHSFDVSLAREYGIEGSILLCQIEFWIQKNKENHKNFRNGRYWTYNTMKELANFFPYLTERQINYTLTKLRKENLIEAANFNTKPLDRTIWYTLTDKGFTILQNCKMHFTNLSNAFDKNVKSINKDTNNTQIIREEINNNYNTARTRENSAPKFEEVKEYAKQNSLLDIAQKFFKYYEASDWLDKDGEPFNWKQKLLSWGNSEKQPEMNAKPKKNFKNREYSQEELDSFFQNIDDIDI